MPTYIDTVLKEFRRRSDWENPPKDHLFDSDDDGTPNNYPESQYELDEEKVETFIKSSLEHFAQMVEKEVIGEDAQQLPRQPGEEILDQTLRNHRTFSENQLRQHQRTRLKALLEPKQEGTK